MTFTLPVLLLILAFAVFMALGVPVSWSLVLTSFVGVLTTARIPISVLAQRMFAAGESYPMLAIPAFFLAGDIMCEGGISKRLISMIDAWFGWISGSLSIVSIASCTLFAAISGSATATTTAIGSIMIPEMIKRGYPPENAGACQAIGGTLGPVIPPSITFIFYATATNLSIAKLLMSGIIPGLIACFFLCVMAYIIAKVKKFPKGSTFDIKMVLKTTYDGLFALLMPVVVMGGIYIGVFTPTEAAGIAVAYGIIISLFVYRSINFGQLVALIKKTAITTSNLLIMVTAAQLFGWFVAYFNIAKSVAALIIAMSATPLIFWLLVNLTLIIAGMFIDGLATVVILAPILHTVAVSFGIDPIHFGLVVVFLLCLGNATPPFGPTLFIASGICKQSVVKVARAVMPFVFVEIACALLFSFVPPLSTFLPGLMK
jgi:C4-dicarboxylate transporter DctM subunit